MARTAFNVSSGLESLNIQTPFSMDGRKLKKYWMLGLSAVALIGARKDVDADVSPPSFERWMVY